MSESEEIDEPKEIKTTPEEAHDNRKQLWLTLLVMLSSSCVGLVVLTVILWLMLRNGMPSG